jgi:hypothetical protein
LRSIFIADANAERRRAAKVSAMRDIVADWKKWSAAERVLAVAVTSAIMAVIVIGMVIV